MSHIHCIAPGCIKSAKGYFCTDCWNALPWDLRAAITTSRRTGTHRATHANRAVEYFKTKMEKGSTDATAGNRD